MALRQNINSQFSAWNGG